jgi:hypothetical protein
MGEGKDADVVIAGGGPARLLGFGCQPEHVRSPEAPF